MNRDIYDSYLLYKQSHPEERISYTKYVYKYKLERKQDSSRKSYAKLYTKYNRKCKSLANLQDKYRSKDSVHKEEIRMLKAKLRKTPRWRRLIRVTKTNCKGCKAYEKVLETPIDNEFKRTSDLLKVIVGLNSVLSEIDINDTELKVLCLAKLCEYLDLKTTMRWVGLGKTITFTSLSNLKNKDLIALSNIKSVTGKKDVNRYYITPKGQEYLLSLLNTISRRSYQIIK